MPKITSGDNPFDKKDLVQPVDQQESQSSTEVVNNMSTSTTPEVAEQSNITSPVSIADLYKEIESELIIKGAASNTGVSAAIRENVDAVFAATGKNRLLLSAVVKICEKQTGKKKLYNLVRSVAQAKTSKYHITTVDGRTYIEVNM